MHITTTAAMSYISSQRLLLFCAFICGARPTAIGCGYKRKLADGCFTMKYWQRIMKIYKLQKGAVTDGDFESGEFEFEKWF